MQPKQPLVQAEWDRPIYENQYSQLLERQTSPTEVARLKAVGSEHASDWLNAIPAEGLGLKLDNASIRICVGLRLGAPICQPLSCPCGGVIDKQGRHPLSCKFSKGRHPRHSHSNDIIKRAMGSVDIPAILEPQGLSKTDNERPDGLSLFPWKSGKCVVWDYTCTCTVPCHGAIHRPIVNIQGSLLRKLKEESWPNMST